MLKIVKNVARQLRVLFPKKRNGKFVSYSR